MIMDTCTEIKTCIACGSTALKEVLDLHEQPLANSYKTAYDAEENKYPLKLNRCTDCYHLQLSHMVDPNEIFRNYLYVSGTSKTHLEYFEWFADMVKKRLKPDSRNVLDIGCNDGSQLNYFKALGYMTYGVDPAENLYPISSKNHNVTCDFFNGEHVKFPVLFDAIVCQNAFSHNYDQHQFLKKCKSIMKENGHLFITTSQTDMIKNGEFDTIYHEHYSYYSIHSMKTLCERSGMYLNDVIRHPIHGNSYIFVISPCMMPSPSVESGMRDEKEAGLCDDATYSKYAESVSDVAFEARVMLDFLRMNKYLIVGYGSPAKGNTFLNYSDCKLDFIIDDNPLKQGLFTPGSSVPIVDIEYLEKYKDHEICFVPLAWNFFEEIVARIKKVRNVGFDLFMKYFPEVDVKAIR